MIEPWERIESTRRGNYKVFHVREDRSRSPRSGEAHSFYVIEASDWINVIPVTPEGQIVCVRQYRHGVEAVTLEIPGGVVDPGETPVAAARRELREETGYDTDDVVYLGHVAPNPAIQNNACHTFLARGVRRVGAQELEGTEIIDVVLVDPAEVPRLVAEGAITHALVVSGFYLYEYFRRAEGARSTVISP